MDHKGQLITAESAMAFLLAGNATITLVSKKTQTRFTYRVRQCPADADGKPKDLFFVSLLRGENNESDYSYLGRIADGQLYIGRKVPKPNDIGRGAPSAIAFDYAWQHLAKGNIPPLLEIWHEGKMWTLQQKVNRS